MRRRSALPSPILVILFSAFLMTGCAPTTDPLFELTGENEPASQVKALMQLVYDLFRPRPDTADYVPVQHAGLNPYGVNTFLEQEVELEKRELAVEMIADAGFQWIRQEFPWEDIEIHGKGDFEDRRHEPHRSAWEKYDHIVELAEKYGLTLIVRLSNPPAWSRADGDTMGSLGPPDDFDDFGDFVHAVVSRYRGRVFHYQLWNEPNIYPEWGDRPVDPVGYVDLLRVGYSRAKAVDPEVTIICGALASTIELDYRNLNDLVFLQQMYDAGAAAYFDVLAMQGYGLWSAPTNRRMQPRVINFSRPLYIRDIMVKNGDAHKPIWLSEMNWNAVPDHIPDKRYGQVTLDEQARYVRLAYDRIQREWPWLGVANVWFFKRATDLEIDQPMYYFRMVEPDFTPLSLYEALRDYATGRPAVYRGFHQEDHWAFEYAGNWETIEDVRSVAGRHRIAEEGATLSLSLVGREVRLLAPMGPHLGKMTISIEGQRIDELDLHSPTERHGEVVWSQRWFTPGPRSLRMEITSGQGAVDGLVVYPWPTWTGWWPGAAVIVVALVFLLPAVVRKALSKRRRA